MWRTRLEVEALLEKSERIGKKASKYNVNCKPSSSTGNDYCGGSAIWTQVSKRLLTTRINRQLENNESGSGPELAVR
jgi:hypothetical protein